MVTYNPSDPKAHVRIWENEKERNLLYGMLRDKTGARVSIDLGIPLLVIHKFVRYARERGDKLPMCDTGKRRNQPACTWLRANESKFRGRGFVDEALDGGIEWVTREIGLDRDQADLFLKFCKIRKRHNRLNYHKTDRAQTKRDLVKVVNLTHSYRIGQLVCKLSVTDTREIYGEAIEDDRVETTYEPPEAHAFVDPTPEEIEERKREVHEMRRAEAEKGYYPYGMPGPYEPRTYSMRELMGLANDGRSI